MNRPQRVVAVLASAALLAGMPVATAAQESDDLVFYVVTHGAASDPYCGTCQVR
jgi:hypothetical protein